MGHWYGELLVSATYEMLTEPIWYQYTFLKALSLYINTQVPFAHTKYFYAQFDCTARIDDIVKRVHKGNLIEQCSVNKKPCTTNTVSVKTSNESTGFLDAFPGSFEPSPFLYNLRRRHR